MKETNARRKRISQLLWLSIALIREVTVDNERLRLRDKSPRPESEGIRGICFVVRDHCHSELHMRTHSKLLFCLGLTRRWKTLEINCKLSEVNTVFPNL